MFKNFKPKRTRSGCTIIQQPLTQLKYIKQVKRHHDKYWFGKGGGVCLFTHLFPAKLRPKQTQTNHNCQLYCIFVFVIVQERIFQKQAKITPKRKKKTSTSLENVSKARAGEANYHFLSSDCQNTPCGITKCQK